MQSDYKTAAALAKLRSKVDRLRKERDGAEAQAAKWLNAQREKLRQEMASTPTAAANGQDSDGSSPENAGGGNGMAPPNGPVVASLKAESSRLKRELDNAKKEAQRLRERAANNTNGSIRGIGDVSTFSGLAGLNLGDSKVRSGRLVVEGEERLFGGSQAAGVPGGLGTWSLGMPRGLGLSTFAAWPASVAAGLYTVCPP